MTNRIATFVGFGMLVLNLSTSNTLHAEEQKSEAAREVQIFTPEYQRQREVATDDQAMVQSSSTSGATPADPNQMRRVEELTQRADHIR